MSSGRVFRDALMVHLFVLFEGRKPVKRLRSVSDATAKPTAARVGSVAHVKNVVDREQDLMSVLKRCHVIRRLPATYQTFPDSAVFLSITVYVSLYMPDSQVALS
ncbi:hypothetical protein PM082_009421 [Marasmius tenuissimus]|nr:hypothetical protein PM082_009421 [Marasmius tenuissimus]